MNLCSDKHDEICYEVRYCPLCECKDEVKELEEQVQALKQEIATME